MTAPLFNATFVLNHFEPTQGGKKKILRLWRITFKRFLMISQRTPTSLVNEIMNRDLIKLIIHKSLSRSGKPERTINATNLMPKRRKKKKKILNHQFAIQLEEYPTISVYSLKPH